MKKQLFENQSLASLVMNMMYNFFVEPSADSADSSADSSDFWSLSPAKSAFEGDDNDEMTNLRKSKRIKSCADDTLIVGVVKDKRSIFEKERWQPFSRISHPSLPTSPGRR